MTVLTNILATPDSALGELGNVTLWVQRREMLLPMAHAFLRRGEEVHRRGAGSASVIVVCDGATPPSAEVRRLLVSRGRTEPFGVAVVIETPGLTNAIVRSVVSGMALAIRSSVSLRAFASLREGYRWLVSTAPAGTALPTAEALREAVDALRKRTG